MSRFHDSLVEARREGRAPGQDSTREDGGAALPTFDALPEGTPVTALFVCSACGAVVAAWSAPEHMTFHAGTH